VQYSFEWDSVKAKANIIKHNVGFERAAEVFLDPFALSLYDKLHSRKEDRWISLGKDMSGALLVVVHTYRDISKDQCAIRIISARKATKHETHQYQTR